MRYKYLIPLIICSAFFLFFFPIQPKLDQLSVIAEGQKINLASLENVLQYQGENYYSFSLKKAKQRLAKTSFLQAFKLKKEFPNRLQLIYTARFPIAMLGNFENRAFDETGAIFPLYPHFAPVNLPEVFFDLRGDEKIDEEHLLLSHCFLKKLESSPFIVHILDLRNLNKEHSGQKEIALHLKEGSKTWVLRLFREKWEKKVELFLNNKEFLQAQIEKDVSGYLVDLRLDQLAYISELNSD